MDLDQVGPDALRRLEEIVGYLNFSSGAEDARFLGSLNGLFGLIQGGPPQPTARQTEAEPAWRTLGNLVEAGLQRLRGSSEAFRQLDQAEAVWRLVFDHVLPAYRRHHRDLLFHHTDESLFGPFFIGRVCQAVLSEGGPWDEPDRIVADALKRLNDFLGHRPVAVLETDQKIEPYAHERVRPIPLYIADAGVEAGKYHDLIEKALDILRSTDRSLVDRAWFDPDRLDELALDPRAYDFDHPVNRRPNHHFGGWDPHRIDQSGFYRRFVLQQVTLDALLTRVDRQQELDHDELLFEAAAVLAGTMLMGSGVSGSGPDAHDSATTLATLLPVIASYRDEFYQRLLPRLPPEHTERLRDEAGKLRQPFGGARQHLNQTLARRRATQLQHVHLAELFAKMGYTEAALRQSEVVPVASARMRCQMHCRLATAHLQIDRQELDAAAALLPQTEDLLHRAIECGAMVDPWNILGFQAQFSLFPAPENSVHDHRIDELIELVGELFAAYARLQKEAAATGRADLRNKLSAQLGKLARWWDRFASTRVSSVEGISGHQAWESAGQVAGAIDAWHQAGTGTGDVAFWKKHVRGFHSPEAFALLAETLLDRGDLVASMALLMLWLSQADEIPLAEGDYALHDLVVRWMESLWGLEQPNAPARGAPAAGTTANRDRWNLARKFFDYLEANADDYWQVPRLELVDESAPDGSEEEPQEEASEDLFSAAYENVTYRDTTDDGFEGEMLEGGMPATDFELGLEAERISRRLALLTTIAQLWKLAAAASGTAGADRDDVLAGWLKQAIGNQRELLNLLGTLLKYRLPDPASALEAMVEYDRRRGIKDMLVERIIGACVETSDAARFVLATVDRQGPVDELGDWEPPARNVLRAMFGGDADSVRAAWPALLEALARQPLLYVPPSRGGSPRRVVASRSVQRMLARLLSYAPRLGLLGETYQLLETIRGMEREHPAGPGAVTEFDRLFEIGCREIVRCLVVSSAGWPSESDDKRRARRQADLELVDYLEHVTEPLLSCWMDHSRNIRLSVLESVADASRWQKLKKFIRRYGRDCFTQMFMNYGNLRSILHQGADAYLRSLEEESDEQYRPKLLDELDRVIEREDAARWLELAIEAVVENYAEYVDYNSTTTQSDRGEMLYTLLDFLRVLASYDRVAWNLKPVVIAHDVLVREGRNGAARIWQQAVAQRTEGIADSHLKRLERLSAQYAMRLPSVADRIGERFVRPLAIDRLCALVRPAIEELRRGRSPKSFRRLEKEVARFTQQPSGVGFDLPSWLEALEDEAVRVRSRLPEARDAQDPAAHVPQLRLSRDQFQRELERWEEGA